MTHLPPGRPLPEGLLSALAHVYGDILSRQGRTTTPFVRWSKVTGRAHEFAWIGGIEKRETLLRGRGPLRIQRSNPLFASVQKMHATATLNPYEREVLYGYPYVIGRREGETVRGPLLTLSIHIRPMGDGFLVETADDVVHVNMLPFRAEGNQEDHEQKIQRVIKETPALPLEDRDLQKLVDVITREFLNVDRRNSHLDGRLVAPPEEPHSSIDTGLWLVDQAALFIAPKSSYFLVSDLNHICLPDTVAHPTALAPLLAGPGSEPQVDLDDESVDRAGLFFPFPSNRSQRRAALLVDDETTQVVRVEGPPGTGKSLTIANLACHLAATGKTVLITSQKDKALEVVDTKLRELDMVELPMTLLHRDRESKKDLLQRLERVKKKRSQEEVRQAFDQIERRFGSETDTQAAIAREYERAMIWEDRVEQDHRVVLQSRGIRRLIRQAQFSYTRLKARRQASRTTDVLAAASAKCRAELLDLAVEALQLGRELAVCTATRDERAQPKELADVLKRDQKNNKNFSLFDRLKARPERAAMLLKLLPVWIMTPDDVARLFPCTAGLFDVVIVDEGSQVDLPSVTPVAFRGKKLVVFGDSKQMQPRRFAFMSNEVAQQSWHRWEMDRLDPDRWLHPSEQSLLKLANVRSQEETLLDEHFRSLPPIIDFSNHYWYGGQLRVMTDERHKRFGRPDQPIIQLHHIFEGLISNGSQENAVEASAVVDLLGRLVTDPDYHSASIGVASIGVMCLFEEQVALMQDLVAEHIPLDEWAEHKLVVVNPDGFQGDERDVILYSLSYDAKNMPQSAISARMMDQTHVQGMLNVAFTRARDEVHIFHSAPLEAFNFAEGRPSALGDWLLHCSKVQAKPPARRVGSRISKVDSQFEADIATALRSSGLRVLHQYPACGFHIDLLAERPSDGIRVAVECDGERYHRDEHGLMKVEDIERQAILERAGWRVVRIPYRKWLTNPTGMVSEVINAIDDMAYARDDDTDLDDDDDDIDGNPTAQEIGPKSRAKSQHATARTEGGSGKRQRVSVEQSYLIEALKDDHHAEDKLLRQVRELLGYERLSPKLKLKLRNELFDLVKRKLITDEDGEYYMLPAGRDAKLAIRPASRAQRQEAHRALVKVARIAAGQQRHYGKRGRKLP